ncbi:hypothetical protein BRCON_2073 [Candidatus Sumerlaea chitinivorans]|uniref:Uncharacterized protein n=1 Tax=Sumerlaea chitinivorans TaxID=2250252 RepID=A0A2Z4Y6L4_SUMC1|nr:hypothetical protein BRCON_2073 [Candidatus Sumerlaea chitinivorans]
MVVAVVTKEAFLRGGHKDLKAFVADTRAQAPSFSKNRR